LRQVLYGNSARAQAGQGYWQNATLRRNRFVASIRAIFFRKDAAMLWNASALTGYPIKAADGRLGTVAGLMFDESDWAIQWLVVDTGTWLSGRRALLPVALLGHPDPDSHTLPVKLTMQQVEDCPDVDASEPLSQEMEDLVKDHYDIPHGRDRVLWSGRDGKSPDVIALEPPEQLATTVSAEREGGPRESHVHRISRITGASIEATDGDIGHAEDFLIDTTIWQVRYLIVHTSSWWPGEKLLVSPQSIDALDWARSIIHLDVSRQKVKDSPPYVAADTVDGAFEELFHTYYGIRWARR
jgi:hypothetical protein